MLYKDFGRRVKQQRILSQMTQEKLAEKAGISFAFEGHIERGTRKASLETLVKLANALGVSTDTLLQDSINDNLFDGNAEVTEQHKRLLREISERILEYESQEK